MFRKSILAAACIAAAAFTASTATAQVVVVQDFDGVEAGELDTNSELFVRAATISGSTFGLSTSTVDLTDGFTSTQALRHNLNDSPDADGFGARAVINGAGSGGPSVPGTATVGYVARVDPAFAGSGLLLSIGIDDPGGLALDFGIGLPAIADGEWHLYQWDLTDSSQITDGGPLLDASNLGDGEITSASVTFDSLVFSTFPSGGNASGTIDIDVVAYNPTGDLSSLVPAIPEPASLALLGLGGLGLVRRR